MSNGLAIAPAAVPDGLSTRVLAGIALSLAVHAALLYAARNAAVPGAFDDGAPPPKRTIAVWLRPPPMAAPPTLAAPQPVPGPSPEARPGPRKPAAPRRRAERAERPTSVIAMPDRSPGAAEPPDVFSVTPPMPEPAPRFDPEAARRVARQIATEPDPARAGTAVGQLPPKPYATETKTARVIASAARRDCKDGLPGGLLAPIYLLMDKKHSGCKW